MWKRLNLSIAVLLLALLPAAAPAAAQPWRSSISVGDWTFLAEDLPDVAHLYAWDISWRIPRAAIIELGYVLCADDCQRVVEVTYRISGFNKYPQLLDLAGETIHQLVPGACESSQFINIRDREGNFLVGALSPMRYICIRP